MNWQKDKYTNMQIDGLAERYIDKCVDRWTGRKIHRQICRQMDWQKDTQTNMQIELRGKTDTHTDRKRPEGQKFSQTETDKPTSQNR